MTIDKEKGYSPFMSMRELIRDNSLLLPAISRFDIAFGFGDKSLSQICSDNNVDVDTFIGVCNLLSGYRYDLSKLSLTSLMKYLKRAHSSFLDVTLPKIRHYLIDAINYKNSNEVALLLMKFYDDYVIEVRKHMEYENEVIFKYVEDLLNGKINPDFNFTSYSDSHSDTAEKLNELKNIFIYHYNQKDNAKLSGALLDIIICERDMLAHFEVENKLFIPLVRNLENELRNNNEEEDKNNDSRPDENLQSPISLLSQREMEIIRGVAQGKVNKEIADQLCISVHTVATHRRNISAKLDIHTSAGLTIFAVIHHLVDVNDVTPI